MNVYCFQALLPERAPEEEPPVRAGHASPERSPRNVAQQRSLYEESRPGVASQLPNVPGKRSRRSVWLKLAREPNPCAWLELKVALVIDVAKVEPALKVNVSSSSLSKRKPEGAAPTVATDTEETRRALTE